MISKNTSGNVYPIIMWHEDVQPDDHFLSTNQRQGRLGLWSLICLQRMIELSRVTFSFSCLPCYSLVHCVSHISWRWHEIKKTSCVFFIFNLFNFAPKFIYIIDGLYFCFVIFEDFLPYFPSLLNADNKK